VIRCTLGVNHHPVVIVEATEATDGAVMITTGRMGGAAGVDPPRADRADGSGCPLAGCDPRDHPNGLAPLNGSSPDVGAVGTPSAFGSDCWDGTTGRRRPCAVIEAITADGVLRQVTADSEPDLLWALRGAGANFGVSPQWRSTGSRWSDCWAAGGTSGLRPAPRCWRSPAGANDPPDELASSVLLLAYPKSSRRAPTATGRSYFADPIRTAGR
jgi:hypothetical protein